ncbi:MAG: hypothetical protein IK054_04380 [Lachnospiraceae bacterium]|nr:hypothetical protein [Lachnospiraceae bacterium]
MANYNAKNYTEQGGSVTHIGGKVVFENGGRIEGSLMRNQEYSEADSVADLKGDFNRLLRLLKGTGIMVGDEFRFVANSVMVDNRRDKADREYNPEVIKSVMTDENSITINLAVSSDDLGYFESEREGIHQWLGIAVDSGTNDRSSLKVNEKYFSYEQEEMFEAMDLESGYFVLWVAADEIKKKGYGSITLEAYGYRKTKVWIYIEEPEEPEDPEEP